MYHFTELLPCKLVKVPEGLIYHIIRSTLSSMLCLFRCFVVLRNIIDVEDRLTSPHFDNVVV